MPDFWTHLIAGEEIKAGIKVKNIKSLLDQNYQQFEKHFEKGISSAQKLIEQSLNYLRGESSLTEILNLFGDRNFLGKR